MSVCCTISQSVSQPVVQSICWSACLSISQSVHQLVSPSSWQFMYPSISPFMWPSVNFPFKLELNLDSWVDTQAYHRHQTGIASVFCFSFSYSLGHPHINVVNWDHYIKKLPKYCEIIVETSTWKLIQLKRKGKLAMSLALNQNYVTWSKNKSLPSNIHKS